MRRVTAALVAFVAVSVLAVTPEDILSIRELRDVRVSPDGQAVAFVVIEPADPTRPRRSNLWLVRTDGSAAQPLPGGSGSDYGPKWSPDGGLLAFLSDRDGPTQVYVRRLQDAAQRLTDAKGGVEQFEWSSDGSMIAFLARDVAPPADPIIVDAKGPVARLWIADVPSGNATRVTGDDFDIAEFAWSPRGDELAVVTAASARPEDAARLALQVVSRASGSVVRTLAPFVAFAGALRWSPDGHLLTFFDAVPSDPFAVWVSVVPAQGGAIRPLLKNYGGTALAVAWMPDGKRFMIQSVEGTHETLQVVDASTGAMRKLTDVVTSQWDVSFSTNGATTAYLAQTPASPSDVWVVNGNGTPRQLTDFNPQTRTWQLGEVREVTWKNRRDGLTRRGVLITPPGYERGRRYPMIVQCHPGDTAWWTGWLAKWWAWGQLLASHGYVVFLPNYRGVTGEGARMHSTIGDWGAALPDLLDGVDSIVRSGIADPQRLGIGGWSNSGFMTEWTITHTPRFKAAVAHAGHSDFFSLFGTSYLRTSLLVTYGVDPYTDRKPYDAHSPITFARHCRTPTLILHGADDPGVPVGQAYELYTALRSVGTPVEMVVYPRERHSLRDYAHQLDYQTRVLAWFDRYLR